MSQILTLIAVLYSYFEIRTSLPKLAAYAATHPAALGALANSVVRSTLWTLFAIQEFVSVLFLTIPYIAAAFPRDHGQWQVGPLVRA